MSWPGRGKTFVVEERREDGEARWTLGRARVTLHPTGRVDYEGPAGLLTYKSPVRLGLDARGALAVGPQGR
ncbi:MAG: hypothetical protein ACE5GW_09140 [Planctomycetota bacterium]